MTDSQFLYQLMLRVNDARAKHPHPLDTPLAAMTAAVSDVAQGIEKAMPPDAIRERALDLACLTLRLAVESANAGSQVSGSKSQVSSWPAESSGTRVTSHLARVIESGVGA